jgi:hypothetical protein
MLRLLKVANKIRPNLRRLLILKYMLVSPNLLEKYGLHYNQLKPRKGNFTTTD